MLCSRMLSLRKIFSVSLKAECQCASVCGAVVLQRTHIRQESSNTSAKDTENTVVNKIPRRPGDWFAQKFLLVDTHYYRLMGVGYMSYEHIVDKIDYQFFFKTLGMPDTFFSWFLVTELHVWMAMVRYMAEGKDGKVVRANLVAAMWEDVKIRARKLGKIQASVMRKQLTELSHQFNAAIIAYDEGIMSDDKVLAGALWGRILALECNNPLVLEKLLIYVRKQVNLFDKTPSEEILTNPALNWIDFKSIR